MKPSLTSLGPRAYAVLHRRFPCTRCGAGAGEWCRGFRDRAIGSCHLARKLLFAEWRKENPAEYRELREQIALKVLRSL